MQQTCRSGSQPECVLVAAGCTAGVLLECAVQLPRMVKCNIELPNMPVCAHTCMLNIPVR